MEWLRRVPFFALHHQEKCFGAAGKPEVGICRPVFQGFAVKSRDSGICGSSENTLPDRGLDLVEPVRRLEDLARLRSVGRTDDAIALHHVDQVSGAAIADAQPPL